MPALLACLLQLAHHHSGVLQRASLPSGSRAVTNPARGCPYLQAGQLTSEGVPLLAGGQGQALLHQLHHGWEFVGVAQLIWIREGSLKDIWA
jgi:hypothetical protein